MKTYHNIGYKIVCFILATITLTSCEDWLNAPQPGVTKLEDFFTSGDAAIQVTTGCYVPLEWEFHKTYFSEWFIGDVVSDDALKGGQNTNDMSNVYDMENWKTATSSPLLQDFYKAQYIGIGRCNLALEYIPKMELDSTLTPELKERLLGEIHFLRAYYYFRLVRVFGGTPKIDFVVDSDSKWKQPRASATDIYAFILKDLEIAQAGLWKKSEYPITELGRATKGAAQAMLLKVNLYLASEGNAVNRGSKSAFDYYKAAKAWGDSVIQSHEYSLCPNYANNFTLAGENGQESVFEIQYIEDPTSDYGEGYGFTRGCFTVILTRSRSQVLLGGNSGWGFNKPTANLYNEYETGDPRRNATIFAPSDAQISNPAEEIYLGDRYISLKYGLYNADMTAYPLAHATRGPINNKQIRYADVLLMTAEAALGCQEDGDAKDYLNEVRTRVSLPTYPGYDIRINGQTITPTLEQAIRHERRVELAMEGHRWFDLCRWGVAKETMDAYKATETPEAQSHMATFIKGKHELFPLPSKEIELNPMTQNPGY